MDDPNPQAGPASEDAREEGQFLSPDDSRPLLSALEGEDKARLAPKRPPWAADPGAEDEFEEGSFVAPGGWEETAGQEEPAPPPAAEAPQAADILSRIAKEVHSIRNELGALKPSQAAPAQDRPATVFEAAPPRPEPCDDLQDELKRLLVYLDGLLESLPEAKIDEFVRSEYFDLYRKVFEHFGLT